MGADRFDSFVEALSTHPSRRGAMRLLAGSALGVLLAGLGLDAAGARRGARRRCRRLGKQCRRARQCCSRRCVDGTCCKGTGAACADGNQCCSGLCANAACTCSPVTTICSADSECCSGHCVPTVFGSVAWCCPADRLCGGGCCRDSGDALRRRRLPLPPGLDSMLRDLLPVGQICLDAGIFEGCCPTNRVCDSDCCSEGSTCVNDRCVPA